MSAAPTDAAPACRVVVNHEGQFSIWPAGRELPPGWADAGRIGSREECLAYIAEVWVDMRPLSLRRQVQERATPGA
jgi:MbtH protein